MVFPTPLGGAEGESRMWHAAKAAADQAAKTLNIPMKRPPFSLLLAVGSL